MKRTLFAIAAAALLFGIVSGSSQAAPIAPLPAGVTSDAGGLTQVRWHWHYHHWHHWRHCWHCW